MQEEKCAPPKKQNAGSERCREKCAHRLKTESQKWAVQEEVFAPPKKQNARSERCRKRSAHRLRSRTPEMGGAGRSVRTAWKQNAGNGRCREKCSHRLEAECRKWAVQGEVFAPPENRKSEVSGAGREVRTA